MNCDAAEVLPLYTMEELAKMPFQQLVELQTRHQYKIHYHNDCRTNLEKRNYHLIQLERNQRVDGPPDVFEQTTTEFPWWLLVAAAGVYLS